MSWADNLLNRVQSENDRIVDATQLRFAVADLKADESFSNEEKVAAERVLTSAEKTPMKLFQLRNVNPDLASFYEER